TGISIGDDTLLKDLNGGKDVRVGLKKSDVLLVGSLDGVLRVVNPLGDPSDPANYPALPSTRASIVVEFDTNDSGFRLEARRVGAQFNGLNIHFATKAGDVAEPASVDWDPGQLRLTFGIVSGVTTAAQLKDAFDAS